MKSFKLFTSIIAVSTSIFLFSGCTAKQASTETSSTAKVYSHEEKITSATEAKKLLEEGNTRYVAKETLAKDISDTRKKDLVTNGQHPFAIIVSCSDSRVAPEVVFDQGLGDLFVIRDAGNVVDAITLGSIEYGAEHLGAPLIVVLGHEKCGAVKATVDGGELPENIQAIVNKIKPSLDKAKATGAAADELYVKTEDENIEHTIAEIEASPVIKHLVEENKVQIVGAKYHIEDGKVEFTE
ncbi:MAG: carbonic anhydrase [Clostridiaceae bacterium]